MRFLILFFSFTVNANPLSEKIWEECSFDSSKTIEQKEDCATDYLNCLKDVINWTEEDFQRCTQEVKGNAN